MEEKHLESSDNKERVEPLATEPDAKIECDEVLSGSESAEMTEEKTDSSGKGTGTDEKLSPMPSESSSGIEMKSESLKSPEQTQSADAAIMDAEATPVSHVEGTVEGAAESTAPVEGGAVEPGSTEDTPAEKTEVGSEISPPEKSKKKGSLVRGAIAYFKKSPHKKDSSPTEKTGVLSRFRLSKSVSSPEKPLETTVEEPKELESEAACATPEDEESFKKGGEKKPVLKRLAKSISNVFKHKSGSGCETEGLVSDQDEPERIPVAGSPVKAKEETAAKDQITPEEEANIKVIYWTEGRQSLTERPSLTLTEKTDLPSTFTGADVFLPGDSRRPSEVGENTSEEAVAGSLASSLGDIKEIASDKDEKSMSSTSAENEVESNEDNKTECKASTEGDMAKEPDSKETDKSAEDVEQGESSEGSVPQQQENKAEEKNVEIEEPKATSEPEKPADADKTE